MPGSDAIYRHWNHQTRRGRTNAPMYWGSDWTLGLSSRLLVWGLCGAVSRERCSTV